MENERFLGFGIIAYANILDCSKLDHCTEDCSKHFVAGSDAPELL